MAGEFPKANIIIAWNERKLIRNLLLPLHLPFSTVGNKTIFDLIRKLHLVGPQISTFKCINEAVVQSTASSYSEFIN